MTRVILIGAGGHAKVVWDTMRAMGAQVIAVLDDDEKIWGHAFMNLKVEGPTTRISEFQAEGAIIAIGDNPARRQMYERVSRQDVPLLNVIHPTAVIAPAVELGKGIVVFANVVVNIGTRIGDNVILNTACTIDHDCIIGAHAHVAPGAHLAGGIRVGAGALIGIGAAIIPNIRVGDWSIVGAGSVVVRDVPAGATVVGSPARAGEK